MIEKLKKIFRYFWIAPTDMNGGWKFQIKIPIGKNPNKHKERRNDF